MRTTLNLDDTLLQRLKAQAAQEGTTMTAIFERALHRELDEVARRPSVDSPPTLQLLPFEISRPLPFDPADRRAMLDFFDRDPGTDR